MSFVDLMGHDVWSEVDIVNRTEAMIASEFPPATVAILNRKATGQALGQYALSMEEGMELMRYAQVSEEARLAGAQARADMVLLSEVLPLEKAFLRLRQPVLEPLVETEEILVDGEPQTVLKEGGAVLNQEALDLDHEERVLAAAHWALGSEAAVALVQLRCPEPPVIEEPEQHTLEGTV